MGKLTKQQVQHFQDEGYLIVDRVFEPDELEPLRQEFHQRINDKARELRAEGAITRAHEESGFDRQLARIYEDNPEAGTAIMRHLEGNAGGGHTGIEMFRVITHPKLLAVVESLVGPEIVGSLIYRVRPKLPRIGRGVVPWHQDSGYFEALCDRHLILTCWVPLVDANEHNGCMKILPRAHRQGVVTHHTGGNAGFLVIQEQDLPLPAAQAITAECPRGGAVFMWNTTPHCSTPNDADHIRWSVDLRYQSSHAPNNAELLPDLKCAEQPPEFQIACYAPEADFIVQSRAQPERVTTFEEFVRRRTTYEQATRTKQLSPPRRGWTPVETVS